MILIHAPAVFDFRNRRDIYFPFLGTSGDVPITPLYEYFPVGFKTLQRYLCERDHDVKIVNLCTILLRYPALKFDEIVNSLDTRLVGIDLHWMVHVQGSLAVAKRIHELRPDISIVFGGISSTYYALELIRYPHVDMVMRGYDTHETVDQLLKSLKAGDPREGVANLLWKDADGSIRDCDVRLAAFALYGAMIWTPNWFHPDEALSAAQAGDALFDIFARGLAPAH